MIISKFVINHCYGSESSDKVIAIMTNPERNFPEYSHCFVWRVELVTINNKPCWKILWHARPAEIFKEKFTDNDIEYLYFEGEYYNSCHEKTKGRIITEDYLNNLSNKN